MTLGNPLVFFCQYYEKERFCLKKVKKYKVFYKCLSHGFLYICKNEYKIC